MTILRENETWKDQINWDDLTPSCVRHDRHGENVRAKYFVTWSHEGHWGLSLMHNHPWPFCEKCAKLSGECNRCGHWGQYVVVGEI